MGIDCLCLSPAPVGFRASPSLVPGLLRQHDNHFAGGKIYFRDERGRERQKLGLAPPREAAAAEKVKAEKAAGDQPAA